MPMLRGMLVVSPCLSTFSSTYKVQQGNSKLLCVAKQYSLAFGVRRHFQSLNKEEQKETINIHHIFSLQIFGKNTF